MYGRGFYQQCPLASICQRVFCIVRRDQKANHVADIVGCCRSYEIR